MNMLQLYLPTDHPELDSRQGIRKSWDDQRLKVIDECISKYLIPSLEAETHRELERLSRDGIIEEAAENYSTLLSVGPFRGKEVHMKTVLKSCPYRAAVYSVAAIVVPASARDDLCMAYVDRDGVLRAHDIVSSKARSQQRTKIMHFLKSIRPEVIVLNSSGGVASKSLMQNIKQHMLREVSTMINKEAIEKREAREERNNYAHYENEEDEFIGTL